MCLALAGLAGLAGAATGTQFTTVGTLPNGPIGVAVSQSQLIVSEWCQPQLDSISDTGAVTPYASIPPFAPNPGICVEMYLAFSPGQNGWAAGDLYVTQDNLVYKVGPGGAPVSLFATIPATDCDSPDRTIHSGITFDTVGTFGNDMIVTCVNGAVWRINTAGTPTLVVDTVAFLEGPAVVPTGFGPKGGQIFVANEALDAVVAISNTGVVTPVVGFKLPEDLEVIPPNPCNFGNSGGSMFGAMYDAGAGVHDVWKWAAADLKAAGPGNLLVTSEGNGGTGLITTDGSTYSVSPFSSETTPHEGADILNCAAPPPPPQGIIAPTQTTCQDFTGGTAQALGQINYSVRGGTIGQGINPGVFFFYTKITTTIPNQVVTVSQSNTSTNNTPLFGILNGQAWLYPANCSSHRSGTVTGPNDSGASYTIPTPGTYIIGIKYQTKTIAGAPAPVPADITYNFTTSLGGGASVLLKKQ